MAQIMIKNLAQKIGWKIRANNGKDCQGRGSESKVH